MPTEDLYEKYLQAYNEKYGKQAAKETKTSTQQQNISVKNTDTTGVNIKGSELQDGVMNNIFLLSIIILISITIIIISISNKIRKNKKKKELKKEEFDEWRALNDKCVCLTLILRPTYEQIEKTKNELEILKDKLFDKFQADETDTIEFRELMDNIDKKEKELSDLEEQIKRDTESVGKYNSKVHEEHERLKLEKENKRKQEIQRQYVQYCKKHMAKHGFSSPIPFNNEDPIDIDFATTREGLIDLVKCVYCDKDSYVKKEVIDYLISLSNIQKGILPVLVTNNKPDRYLFEYAEKNFVAIVIIRKKINCKNEKR